MKTTLLPALQASVVALSLCAATTPASALAAVGLPAAAMPAPKPQGWWQGFHDADIDRLVPAVLRAADAAAPNAPRPTQLVAVLVGLREYAMHAVLSAERLAALQAQRRLAAASRPSREAAAALARLDARVRAARDQLDVCLQLRDAYFASWQVIAGPVAQALPVSLQAGLGAAALPSFEAQPPAALPDGAGAALAQPLQDLRSAQAALALEVEQLQRSERHFHSRHASGTPGEGALLPADAQALESYAQLLSRAGAVVSAKARLALAWVQFHHALGQP